MKQNITLSLNSDLLLRAKVLAAQRNTSVSRMLAEKLETQVQQAENYERARRAALALMDTAKRDLGGKPLRRDDLYRSWPRSTQA